MGKLVEYSNGYYILEVEIAGMTVKKCFKESDISAEEITNNPKPDGFYLYIPDLKLE